MRSAASALASIASQSGFITIGSGDATPNSRAASTKTRATDVRELASIAIVRMSRGSRLVYRATDATVSLDRLLAGRTNVAADFLQRSTATSLRARLIR